MRLALRAALAAAAASDDDDAVSRLASLGAQCFALVLTASAVASDGSKARCALGAKSVAALRALVPAPDAADADAAADDDDDADRRAARDARRCARAALSECDDIRSRLSEARSLRRLLPTLSPARFATDAGSRREYVGEGGEVDILIRRG